MCAVEMSGGKSGDQTSGVCRYNTHELELMLDTHMMLSNRGNEGHDF